MAKYIVTYDLVGSEKVEDYTKLIRRLDKLGTVVRHQRSVWILESSMNQDGIMSALLDDIDDNDRLIVGTLQSINSKNKMISGIPAPQYPPAPVRYTTPAPPMPSLLTRKQN
mgnify:CR=1 FL=1